MPVDFEHARFRKPIYKEVIYIQGRAVNAAVSRLQADIPAERIRFTPSAVLIVWTDESIDINTVFEYKNADYTIAKRENHAFKSWMYSCNGPTDDP